MPLDERAISENNGENREQVRGWGHIKLREGKGWAGGVDVPLLGM